MNIVLIFVDAFRRDKIGAYINSDSSLTPTIDRFARDGTILKQHMTVLNGSTPTLISLFTGLYPSTHTIHENGYELPTRLKTLAEYLKEEGYSNCGVVSSGALGSVYKFNKGFDTFFDNSKHDKLMRFFRAIGYKKYNLRNIIRKFKISDIFDRKCTVANSDAFKWLDDHYKEKFFLFIHYFDIHADTFGKLNNRTNKKFLIENYNENVKLIDSAINELSEKLKQLGVFEDTMIIITADHGEDLEEEFLGKGHGFRISDPQFRVPCIFYKLGIIQKNNVDNLTRSIDILPTILDLIGSKQNISIDGISIKDSILNNKDIVDEVFIESYPVHGDIKGIRTNQWLYTIKDGKKEELYDITKDIELENNLSENHKELCSKFKIKVKRHFSIPYEESERDEYTKEMLRELGYLPN